MLRRFEEGDLVGIVLELVPGRRNLEQMLLDVKAGKAMSRSLRWRLDQLRCVLDALDAAHRRSVIHRDVKPANILFDRDAETLKLSDFGIARILEHYGKGSPGATLHQFYTRPYAAPEQVLRGDATFASDVHAFGLVAAALLSGALPSEQFRTEELPTLLEPLRPQIKNSVLYQSLVDVLKRALSPEPAARPRLAAIEQVLAELVEKATEQPKAEIRIPSRVREKAEGYGVKTTESLLEDLNDGLRARYEEKSADRTTGETSFSVRCLGRGLWAILKPEDGDPEKLVMVDVGRNPGPTHARQRERGTSPGFRLVEGTGSTERFVAVLYEAFESERRQEELRRKKESLLSVARFTLAAERQRMLRLRVSYRVLADTQGAGVNAAGPAGLKALSNRDQYEARAGHLRVQVLEVAPWDLTSGSTDEMSDDWADGLDPKTPFLLDRATFATFHKYDRHSRTLTLRVGQALQIPREGTFECKDVALDTSLRRQEKAIDRFVEDACVNQHLGRLLLFPEENSLGEVVPRRLLQVLEPQADMQALVQDALAAKDFFLVQGPPGTGKTTVITEVMAQILAEDPNARILLTSQANEAVSNALDALRVLGLEQKQSWRLLRDISPDRAEQEGGGFDQLFAEWAAAVRKRSRAAIQSLTKIEAPNAEAIRRVLTRWDERLDKASDVKDDYAESVQVFGVTCLRVPTLWRRLREVRFDWVIVDEAAKATAAEVMVSLVVGRKFVMVGDHRQLPPFLDHETEKDLKDAGIDHNRAKRSLFEELFGKVPDTNRRVMRRQFRMHRSIGKFVGDLFYADIGLETGVADEERGVLVPRLDRPHRVFWLNVKGDESPMGHSWWNQAEVDAVMKMLSHINRELQAKSGEYKVGVIAAYAAQAARLQEALVTRTSSLRSLKVVVDTVDAFQGKQVEILIYSLVRVSQQENPFIGDRRRLNVAFSRGKRALIIVGHRDSAERQSGLARALQLIPSDNLLSLGDIS
jgi:hypothetical protein